MPQNIYMHLEKCVHRITVCDVQNAKTLHRSWTDDGIPQSGSLQQSAWMILPHFITTESHTHNGEQGNNMNCMLLFMHRLKAGSSEYAVKSQHAWGSHNHGDTRGKLGALGRVRAMIQMLVMWKAVGLKQFMLYSLHICHLGHAWWQSISMYFDEFVIKYSF